MTEDTAFNPSSRKGAVRAQIANEWFARYILGSRRAYRSKQTRSAPSSDAQQL
jgi:hypothetical protein